MAGSVKGESTLGVIKGDTRGFRLCSCGVQGGYRGSRKGHAKRYYLGCGSSESGFRGNCPQ